MTTATIPVQVVQEDHALDAQAGEATEALARFRWHHTLDPEGPRFAIQTYAVAVGRNEKTIRRHAKGYEMFVARARESAPGADLDLEGAFRLSEQSAENQAFSEAIAEGSGQPVRQVARGDHAHQRQAVITRARERAERRGTDPVDEARDIAREDRAVAQSRTRQQTERRESRSVRFVSIEGHLAYAKRRLLDALAEAEGVDFSEEELDLLRSSIANVRAVLNLIDARVAGKPDVDWDAELAKLAGGAP